MKNTNKLILLSVLGIFMTTYSFGQIHAGLRGGMNFSNLFIDAEDLNDESVKLGYQFGVFAQFLDDSESIGIQPELNFTTKGAKATYDVFGAEGKGTFNLNYIELPVMVVFKLGESVDINAGAYAAYLVHSSVSTEGDFGNANYELDRDHFKPFDYGLVGGLAFNFNAISVGLRYNYGLSKVADDEDAQFLLGDAKNGVGSIYIALNLVN